MQQYWHCDRFPCRRSVLRRTGLGNPEKLYEYKKKKLHHITVFYRVLFFFFTYFSRQSSVAGREQETKNAFTNGECELCIIIISNIININVS